MTPIRLPDGRWVVPGNRWDLAPVPPAPTPTVSVVIPYFRQQRELEFVLTALTLQTHPAGRLQVIVADDGSPEPPDVRGFTSALDIRVVQQPDQGFRAAAARNLGAAAADGSVLCFLDADTVPEPGYVAAAVSLPATVPDALVVGRRRHADLAGWTPEALCAWLTGGGPRPPELTEPRWLLDAYAGSRDLLDADRRSYRHIISAVMTCTASLFAEMDGFDESFVAYGGEDWEFAHRAFDAGAVFAHRRDAVAWHDGPDWAERDDTVPGADRTAKNAEALALSPLITDPAARTHGLIHAIPEVVAVVSTEGHSTASLLVTVGSLVSAGDCQVWIDGPGAQSMRAAWGDIDPRVHIGSPPETGHSRFALRVDRPVRWGRESLSTMIAAFDAEGLGRMTLQRNGVIVATICTARSLARGRRWADALGRDATELADALFPTAVRDAADYDVDEVPLHPRLDW